MSHIIFTVLSIFSLIAGLYLYKKMNPLKITMGLFFVMVFSSIFLFIAYGVANYFTGNGIDESIIYHLEYGLDGAGFLEYSWLIVTTIIVIMLSGFYLLRFILKGKNDQPSHIFNSLLSFSFLLIAFLLNPASIDIYNLKTNYLILTEPLIPKTIRSFYKYYKTPYIKTSESNHKNIIFIYAESLERTYFDKTIFPGLINGLRELESRSTYFTNIKQVAGTGWTVAGMTASQCGIPLSTPSHGNSMSGMDQFLPLAVCLGDLLNENGYQLNYMGGASLQFAGKGKLLKTHGFTNLLGRDELLPKLEDKAYKTSWGLYDDSLFNMVYSRFIELSEAGKKFGLFTLTLDTHHPNGHPSKSCKGREYKDASNPILNAVACSDYLISNFIKKISQSPYADKTIIVLVSDHLSLRNTAFQLLHKKKRRNLFMIIDPSKNIFSEINALGSTLDIGATILPFMGYKGAIGLGRNLLNNEALEKERQFIHFKLIAWRHVLATFWNFPKIQKYLEIDIDKKIVRIDGRNFRIPIFIELNNQLESTLKFQFDKSQTHKTLVQHRKLLSKNKGFLLIDKCKNTKILDKSLGENGFCFLSGKGRKYTKKVKLNRNITYTSNQVRQLLNFQP